MELIRNNDPRRPGYCMGLMKLKGHNEADSLNIDVLQQKLFFMNQKVDYRLYDVDVKYRLFNLNDIENKYRLLDMLFSFKII